MQRTLTSVTPASSSMRKRVVRANAAEIPSAAPAEPVVWYTNAKGNRVKASESEYSAAVASGDVWANAYGTTERESVASAPVAEEEATPVPSLGEIMAFSGPAPETFNGRLAMLAFVTALAAELNSGKTVLEQFALEPTGVLLTAGLIIVGGFVPILGNVEVTNLGPFTAEVEKFNGRAAMVGLSSMLVIEGVSGSSLF